MPLLLLSSLLLLWPSAGAGGGQEYAASLSLRRHRHFPAALTNRHHSRRHLAGSTLTIPANTCANYQARFPNLLLFCPVNCAPCAAPRRRRSCPCACPRPAPRVSDPVVVQTAESRNKPSRCSSTQAAARLWWLRRVAPLAPRWASRRCSTLRLQRQPASRRKGRTAQTATGAHTLLSPRPSHSRAHARGGRAVGRAACTLQTCPCPLPCRRSP